MTNDEILYNFRSDNAADIRTVSAYCIKQLLPAVLRFLKNYGSEGSDMGIHKARQLLKEAITDFWAKCQDPDFQPNNALSYLVGMYRNKWLNELNRYHKRHDLVAPVKDHTDDKGTPFDGLKEEQNPLAQLLDKEQEQQNVHFFKYVFRAIITNEEDKQILIMCFVEGLKPHDIAKRLDKKANTVSKRIFDLKRKIKKHMESSQHYWN